MRLPGWLLGLVWFGCGGAHPPPPAAPGPAPTFAALFEAGRGFELRMIDEVDTHDAEQPEPSRRETTLRCTIEDVTREGDSQSACQRCTPATADDDADPVGEDLCFHQDSRGVSWRGAPAPEAAPEIPVDQRPYRRETPATADAWACLREGAPTEIGGAAAYCVTETCTPAPGEPSYGPRTVRVCLGEAGLLAYDTTNVAGPRSTTRARR